MKLIFVQDIYLNAILIKKHQVVLLKIGDDSGKWLLLALPINLDEDGVSRPKKSISRLLEGIWSKSHDDFYFFGCLHSFRREKSC